MGRNKPLVIILVVLIICSSIFLIYKNKQQTKIDNSINTVKTDESNENIVETEKEEKEVINWIIKKKLLKK